MHKTLIFLKKELLELLPPFLFFMVVFHVLSLMRTVLEAQYHITALSAASATIAALVAGKSILLANALPIFHWFGKRRLIYNVLWRIALYMLIILLFQYLEELIPLWSKYGSPGSAQQHLVTDFNGSHFWISHLVLLMFVTFYALVVDLVEALGARQTLNLFISPRVEQANEH